MRFFLLFFLFIVNVYSDELGNEISLNYDPKGGAGEFLVLLKNCDYILEEDVYKTQAAAHCESHKISLVRFDSSPFRNNGCEISYSFQCETKEYKKERQMAKEAELARINAQKAQLAGEARQKALWDKELRQIEIEVKKAQEKIKQERSQEETKQGRSEVERGSPLSMINAKQKCKELGFKSGTEKFGTCVLELTK